MLRECVRKTLGLDPLLAEQTRLVAVGAVAQDRDNVLAGAQLLGHLDRGHHVQGRRGADVDTFLVQESVNHLERLGIGDLQRVVNQLDVGLQVLGDTALTNTYSLRYRDTMRRFG